MKKLGLIFVSCVLSLFVVHIVMAEESFTAFDVAAHRADGGFANVGFHKYIYKGLAATVRGCNFVQRFYFRLHRNFIYHRNTPI